MQEDIGARNIKSQNNFFIYFRMEVRSWNMKVDYGDERLNRLIYNKFMDYGINFKHYKVTLL